METVTDYKLHHPSVILCFGCSQSGKSCLIRKLVRYKDQVFQPVPPARVIWIGHGAERDVIDPWRDYLGVPVLYRHGFDADLLQRSLRADTPTLVVLEDQMTDASHFREALVNLVIRGSHHLNTTLVVSSQNLFYNAKYYRTMAVNAHYLIMFGDPRSGSTLRALTAQLDPRYASLLSSAYRDATEPRYGYLLCSFHPTTDHRLHFRSRLFPDEGPTIVYLD